MKYILDFDTNLNKVQERSYTLSGVSKATYIAGKVLETTGECVDIISTALTKKRSGYVSAKKYVFSKNISVKLFSTFGCKTKILKGIRYYGSLLKIFFYLFLHVSRNEKVILYHEMKLSSIFLMLKKLKKFNLILEVEEIYSDVRRYTNRLEKNEFKIFKNADAYIFPTELLNRKINTKNKPYAIIHGTYNVEPVLTTQFNDGKIHCVYAGTFDPRKGGAAAAAAAGLFLNSNYHIHIIGFGSENDKKMLINAIEEVSKKTECKVTYDGCLSGEAYLKFIQKCHIGLSTQNPNAAFNDTSFPSKILSYMANGLRVVSVRIPAIEGSAIGKYMYYYEEQTPEKIAQAIKQVDIGDDYDSRKIIAELDKQFQEDLQIIL